MQLGSIVLLSRRGARRGSSLEREATEVLRFERLGVGDGACIVLYGDNFGLSAARLISRSTIVVSKENPTLRPAAQLRKLYEEAGVQQSRTIVTYCRTGGQASHTYFTLKYLGYEVVMYDGSFFEWSNTEGAPVVAGRERK